MELSITEMLTKMIEMGASDLHITVGVPPTIRVDGALIPLPGYEKLRPDDTQQIVYSLSLIHI